jgi:hypothetical protein
MKQPRSLNLAIREVATKLRAERDKYEGEREAWNRSDLAGLVVRLADKWRSEEVPKDRSPRNIDDPLYGRVNFDTAVSTVLAHPLVQRLHRVKQLSFSFTDSPTLLGRLGMPSLPFGVSWTGVSTSWKARNGRGFLARRS